MTIDLILKHKWYDMINEGKKPEEYRDIKPHYDKTLGAHIAGTIHIDRVRLHRGYTSTTQTFNVREIVKGTGNPEWGAEPEKRYYVIRLGQLVGSGA